VKVAALAFLAILLSDEPTPPPTVSVPPPAVPTAAPTAAGTAAATRAPAAKTPAPAVSAAPAAPSSLSPHDIVARADAIRFPQTAYEVDVTVTSTPAGGGKEEKRRYQILSKGNDKTLVITTEPAADKGQVLLMKDKDLWLYLPTLSQPIRLPLSQRATGQVANGDLARANFASDYSATIARTEDAGEPPSPHFVLELTAAEKGMTYNRLLYWVEKKTLRPFKAEFYGLSGKLLKTCHYRNFVDAGGARRPRTVVMEDALVAGAKSVLDYSGFKVKEIPDKYFSKDYLKKLDTGR
jgi:outer membrane lipoprotein-sorting protein